MKNNDDDRLNLDDELLETRRIFLWGDIVEELAKDVVQALRYLTDASKEDIYIYIHSNGGDTDSQYAIIDEIEGTRERGITVYTIAQGKALSAAANILALGTTGCRFATKNTTIMLHTYSLDLSADYVANQQALTDFSKKQNDEIYKTIAKACNKSSKQKFDKFMSDIRVGLWLNAKNALSYGLIDGIWDYKWEDELIGKATNIKK